MKAPPKGKFKFKSEDEERDFWAENSPLDFFDAKSAQKAVFPNLKPALKPISLRMPEDMLMKLKVLANKKDVPYQSLAKLFIERGLNLEKKALVAK